MSRALLQIYKNCHGHFSFFTGIFLAFLSRETSQFSQAKFGVFCYGHFFKITGTFLKNVTGKPKNVTGKKNIDIEYNVKSSCLNYLLECSTCKISGCGIYFTWKPFIHWSYLMKECLLSMKILNQSSQIFELEIDFYTRQKVFMPKLEIQKMFKMSFKCAKFRQNQGTFFPHKYVT